MGRRPNRQIQAAARAREGKARRKNGNTQPENSNHLPENEECSWDGTVNHCFSDTDVNTNSSSEGDSDSASDEFSEMDEDELITSFWETNLNGDKLSALPNAFDKMAKNITSEQWEKAESNRHLGYNGHSDRTKRRKEQALRAKEVGDSKMRKRCVPRKFALLDEFV